MKAKINLIRTHSAHEDFNALIVLLDKELYSRNLSAQANYDKHNKIEFIDTVVVAYDGELPVGCGCFKEYGSDTVEIKRMFVAADYRCMGISKLILNELENWAKDLGFSKAVLETGIKQSEAVGLYKKANYTLIENYGPYKDMTMSLCFAKNL